MDINEYKKDFKMFCDKAAAYLKEEKFEEAARIYKETKTTLET